MFGTHFIPCLALIFVIIHFSYMLYGPCLALILFHVSQMSTSGSEDSSDDDEHFFSIIQGGAKLAETYVNIYMDKAPPRTSQLSGMGWVSETLNTLGESHRMFRMNEFIFMDLHDVLVSRYGLKPSKFMNTYEMLAIFLFTCGGCESNRKVQNRFKHSGDTISKKFHKVLDCVVGMAIDYLRPTDPNFRRVHKRIRNDKKHIHTLRIV
jgi:hypothetical protein